MLTRQRFLHLCGAAAAVPLLPRLPAARAQVAPESLLFNVRDFGAKGDGVTNDARAITAAVQAAIAKGNGATVIIPAGRYLLSTIQQARARTIYENAEGVDLARAGYAIKAHVLLTGARQLSLVGEPGTVLVMKDATSSGIWIERCDDVVVRDITIDYDPLPFSQGTIVDLNPLARTFDWRVQRGYLEPPLGYLALAFDAVDDNARGLGFGNVFHPDGTLKFGACNGGDAYLAEMSELGGGLYRCRSMQALGTLDVGDRFGWPARSNFGGHAVALTLSNRCRLENVTVHSAPVLAFLANDCDALAFMNCVIERLPGADRLYAANADGIHAKSNRRGPHIEGCRFEHHGDDSATIVQTGQRLFAQSGPAELIVELDQYQLFRPGDRLAVISQVNGLTKAEAVVRDVAVVRFRDRMARKIRLDRQVTRLVSIDSLDVGDIPPPAAGRDRTTPLTQRPDIVADLDLVGSGFVVRGNVFANHRASGVRVYATDGLIERNRFENLGGHGLQLGMELNWHEVHHAQRITIRDNKFVGISNSANIWLHSLLGNYDPADGMGNQDVTIERNEFAGYGARLGGAASGAVTVNNAQAVRIRNNAFAAPERSLAPMPRAVRLDLCRDVTVEDNAIVQHDSAVDPIQVTARADRRSLVVRRNRLER